MSSVQKPVAQPAEHRVVERDRPLVVQHVDLDVVHSAPAHGFTVSCTRAPTLRNTSGSRLSLVAS